MKIKLISNLIIKKYNNLIIKNIISALKDDDSKVSIASGLIISCHETVIIVTFLVVIHPLTLSLMSIIVPVTETVGVVTTKVSETV